MSRGPWIASGLLVAAALSASVIVYPRLPDRVPTHWNVQGQVDGTGDKSWAAFAMPAAMALMIGVFAALPWLSPRKFSVDSFRSTYLAIMVIVVALLGYIHGLTLYAGLTGTVDVARALVGGLMLFLAAIGNLLGRVRRNFYVGIKTPWTLASERVWNDTHRLAAWTFTAGGLIGAALGLAGFLIASTAVLAVAALVPVFYSFAHYKRLERAGALDLDQTPAASPTGP